ncbi:MAG TPA: ABC transporter substrate-binding protein [Acetobacteraceae bacterium]|nr:ABC transporter substrate-binding protein [Acetobacteraceae bacterium]
MSSFDLSRRSLLGGSAAIGATLAFAGLAEAQNASGTMTVGVPATLTTLDPANANDTLSQSVARLLLEGLLGFDKDMKVIPLLAESYEASEDAKEFTFHLRKGIKFQDGTPFDASAVKVNFERVADPSNHLKRQSLLATLDHVEVVDPYTAKCVLRQPFGAFIPTIAHPALQLLSPAALKKYGAQIGRNPVGTGPFRFVRWSPDTLEVAAHPNYWQKGLPHMKSVTVRSNPEDGPRIAMLQAGEAQFIYPVPAPMVKLVQNSPKLALVDDPSIIVNYVAMNVTKKPYSDLRVRQALNHAIDKQAFIKIVFNGYAKPLLSAQPPKVTFYAEQPAYDYDPKKARALLAAAGYKDGFETTIWASTQTQSIQAMQFIQQQFAAVGIKVNVVPLESGVLDSRIWSVQKAEDSKLELYYGGWSSSTGDADWALRPLFWSKGGPPTLYNVGYYSNPDVDRDLEGALQTADPAKRGTLYADAQKRIVADAAWVFLVVQDVLAGRDKRLADAWRLPDGGLLVDAARMT